jgi:hypothetical protein
MVGGPGKGDRIKKKELKREKLRELVPESDRQEI